MEDRERIPRIMEKLEALWYDHPEWSFQRLVGREGVGLILGNIMPLTDHALEKDLDLWITEIAGA